ncbi:MAG: hypothetical protein AAGL49_04315 [Pseudomonadota bacterium]
MTLVIFLTWIALWPRPYFKPNWTPPYDKAVQSGDCNRALAILRAAEWAEDPEANRRRAMLFEEGACGFEADQEQADDLRRFAENFEFGFAEAVARKSLVSEVLYAARQQKSGGNPYLRKLRTDQFHFYMRCKTTAVMMNFGASNYDVLRGVLADDTLTELDVDSIIHAEQRYCAQRAIDLAGMMNTVHPGVRYNQEIARLWHYAGLISDDPEISAKFHAWHVDYKAFLVNAYDLASTEKEREQLDEYPRADVEVIYNVPTCPLYAPEVLGSSIQCVQYLASEFPEDPYVAAKIIFHAKRADLLGHAELTGAVAKAASQVSNACKVFAESAATEYDSFEFRAYRRPVTRFDRLVGGDGPCPAFVD